MQAIFKREFRAYFKSPIGYIFLGAFIFYASLMFVMINLNAQSTALTGFFSNYPTQQTMTEIFAFLSGHQLTPDVGAVYPFEGISQAVFDMDHHRVNGKIVVRL